MNKSILLLYFTSFVLNINALAPKVFGVDFPSRSELEYHMRERWVSSDSLTDRIDSYYNRVEHDYCRKFSIKEIDVLVDSKTPFIYIEEYESNIGLIGSILAVKRFPYLLERDTPEEKCSSVFKISIENEEIWKFVSDEANRICQEPVSFGFNSTQISLHSIVYYDGTSFFYASFEMPWSLTVPKNEKSNISIIGKNTKHIDALMITQSYRFRGLCMFLDNMLGGNTFISSRIRSADKIFKQDDVCVGTEKRVNEKEGESDWKEELLIK